MRIFRMTTYGRACTDWILTRQGTLARLLRSVRDSLIVQRKAVGGGFDPMVRMEIVFSLSALVFLGTALTAIVLRAAGDQPIVVAFAAAAGAFGASTSILGAYRSRACREAGTDSPGVSLLPRVVLGSGLAYLYYLFTKWGVLSGGPFPDLSHSVEVGTLYGTEARVLSVADFMKLMAGCFLAGFTERWFGFIRRGPGGRN